MTKDLSPLLPLYFEGKTTPEQTAQVESWIAENEENKVIAEKAAAVYQFADTILALEGDEKKSLDRLHRRIHSIGVRKTLRWFERVAAILFIPLLVTGALLMSRKSSDEIPERTMSTPPSMTASTTLPDGTTVILNSGSTISFPAEFSGGERRVKLDGEAWFEVAHNPESPFYVETPQNATVKVYGTSFDVDAYSAETTMKVVLKEGSVSLLYTDSEGIESEWRLRSGDRAIYDSVSRMLDYTSRVNVSSISSWTTGKLVFQRTSVPEMLRSLSKRYGVKFIIRNQAIKEYQFTGMIDSQSLDKVLEYISTVSRIRFNDISDPSEKDFFIEVY